MLRSLFSAISGLQAHQTKLDVVGNNIANVNTVGYKSSTTVFEDTLSQLLSNGSAPTATTAGTDPAQVGLGVRLAGVTTNFQQGSTESTGRNSDFMISGDGFFITKSGNQQLYTRAGSFDIDGSGRLHTPDGAILQGWMATNGVINTNGPIGDLSIPYGQVINPKATTDGMAAGNLDAGTAVTSPPTAVQSAVTMYDPQGNAHQISYIFSKTGTNTWQVDVQDDKGVSLMGGTYPQLTFDAAGQLTSPTPTVGAGTPPPFGFTFTPPWSVPPPGTPLVTVNLSGVTQFGSPSTAQASKPVTGAGSAMGTLESYALGNDGTITGVFSNGLKQPIGQLALATFANPGGLTKAGNSAFEAGTNSGVPQVGTAGTGGRGTLSAGALEMSNVDLAQEFTGLIIAQRGFQANSKVITTSDQILQDLVNMKQ